MDKPPFDPLAKVLMDGIVYDQVVTSNLKEGDLVINIKEYTVGTIDAVLKEGYVAVRYGFPVEVGVPMGRLRKLIPSIETNSCN